MLRTAAVTILALGAAGLALAQWSADPGVNTGVGTSQLTETMPLVVRGGGGDFIVFWKRHEPATPPFPVWYHRYVVRVARLDAGGVSLWPEPIGVGFGSLSERVIGGSAPVSDGGLIVAHAQLYEPGYFIHAARITPGGTVPWNMHANAQLGSGVEWRPTITSDGQGGGIVAWADRRNGSNYDIYAQRVNETGQRLWAGPGVPLCSAAGDQWDVRIVSDGVGGAIVVWTDARTQPTQIYAQRVDASGTALWAAQGIPIAPAAGPQTQAALASDGQNGATAVWIDERDGPVHHLYGQRVNGAGAPQWGPAGLAVAVAAETSSHALAPTSGGGAVVAWSDARQVSTGQDVYAQKLDSSGLVWPANGVPVSRAPADQVVPAIDSDGAGGAVLAWEDRRAVESDVYTQRLDASGQPLWAMDGRPASLAPAAQDDVSIVSDGSGGAVIVWEDARPHPAGASNIFAQHVNADGSLPVTLQRFVVE